MTVPNLQDNSSDVKGISGYKVAPCTLHPVPCTLQPGFLQVYSTGSSSLAPLLEAAGLLEEPEHLSQVGNFLPWHSVAVLS